MPKKFDIVVLVDSLATVSDILFKRLKTMECNKCEPCGETFMNSLNTLRKAGNIQRSAGRAAKKR